MLRSFLFGRVSLAGRLTTTWARLASSGPAPPGASGPAAAAANGAASASASASVSASRPPRPLSAPFPALLSGSPPDLMPTPKRKRRPKRAKRTSRSMPSATLMCCAYSTAEAYDFKKLAVHLKTSFQITQFLPHDPDLQGDCLRVVPLDADGFVVENHGDALLFRDGAFVSWGLSEDRIQQLRKLLSPAEISPHPSAIVSRQREAIPFHFCSGRPSCYNNDSIELREDSGKYSLDLDKFTLSDGIANSVTLGVYEVMLDSVIDQLEMIPRAFMVGKEPELSKRETMQRIGRLFLLRHRITLSGDLSSPSDFYWEKPDCELIYRTVAESLEMQSRVDTFNDKLNHSHELLGLLRDHQTETHSHRLEKAIIVLIMVEVVIAVVAHWSEYRAKQHEKHIND